MCVCLYIVFTDFSYFKNILILATMLACKHSHGVLFVT